MIHISIDIVITSIILLSIVLLGIYIYLVVKRKVEQTYQKRREIYIEEKLTEWDSYFRGEITLTNEMIPRNTSEIQAVETIFLTYIKNTSDVEMKEKIQSFSCQYLKDYYQPLLKSKRWSIRINTLSRVLDFRMDCLLDECKKLEQKRLSYEEKFLLLIVYSRMDVEHFYESHRNNGR